MTGSDLRQLREDLKRDEALRLLPYDDATGHPIRPGDILSGQLTIGWGRNLSGRGITADEAEAFLDQDIRLATSDVMVAYPWVRQLDGARQLVLIEMCFNMGLTKFKGFTKMLAAVEAGNFQTAAVEMLDSQWADQVGARATRLASVMHSGEIK